MLPVLTDSMLVKDMFNLKDVTSLLLGEHRETDIKHIQPIEYHQLI